MKYLMAPLVCIAIWLCACADHDGAPRNKGVTTPEAPRATPTVAGQLSTPAIARFIDTDTIYTLPQGGQVRIQNSYPKGGSIAPGGVQYTDAAGREYAFASFWTRITNNSADSLTIELAAPADPLAIFDSVGSYLRVLLPAETPTYEKLAEFNYGLTEIESFLDAQFVKATEARRTIGPGEASMFYVATLTYRAAGRPRAALYLRDRTLFYRIEVRPHGSGSFPIGSLELLGGAGVGH